MHKLADPLPEGEIITDLTKGQWRLGKPIGSGGFGVIYLGSSVALNYIRIHINISFFIFHL